MRDHPFKTSASFRGGGGRGNPIVDVCRLDGYGSQKSRRLQCPFPGINEKKIEKEVSKLFYAIPSLCCIFFVCNSLFNGLIV